MPAHPEIQIIRFFCSVHSQCFDVCGYVCQTKWTTPIQCMYVRSSSVKMDLR